MAKTKISEFSATPANNTDIDSINIAEGCAPSGINDAIRELMAQLKDFQTGAVGDSFNGPIGATTASTGAFTTLAASGAVTLSGGTANGVTYLNGSKVLTSGSALVFDGTSLGVGVASPTKKLDILSNTSQDGIRISGSANPRLTIIDTTTPVQFDALCTDTEAVLRTDTNHPLVFSTNGTERMRLDTSGNLGLGVTPSAWGSGWKGFQVGSRGSLSSSNTSDTLLVNNGYNDGTNWKYLTTAGSTAYNSDGIQHRWYLAPSGTAGNAISFTQAMTLDASGNLGVGTTNPTSFAGKTLQVNSSSTSVGIKLTNSATGEGNSAGFDFELSSSDINYVNRTGSGNQKFWTNSTERARITSTGNVLFNNTTTSATSNMMYYAVDEANNAHLVVANTSATDNLALIYCNRQTSDGKLIEFRQANTAEGSITVSGTTVSYNGGHLSRWSQLPNSSKDDTILKGTVLSNLDNMCVWEKDGVVADNEQLNKMKVSDVEGDTNVAGVFVNWTKDEQYDVDDMNVAMTGDMIIRIAQGVTVVRGDLLMSAGDGTAKPQGDDIVRSKTVAKVTSNHITCTYADGSYCVPCVLMAC